MGAMVGAGASGHCIGDASLSKRPMGRVIDPLTQMGAVFRKPDGSDTDKLPLQLDAPARALPLAYELPVPSAQVKSAILLAGLGAPGQTIVRESHPTRDHTERMLKLFWCRYWKATQTRTVLRFDSPVRHGLLALKLLCRATRHRRHFRLSPLYWCRNQR